jgi:hypothetical protein
VGQLGQLRGFGPGELAVAVQVGKQQRRGDGDTSPVNPGLLLAILTGRQARQTRQNARNGATGAATMVQATQARIAALSAAPTTDAGRAQARAALELARAACRARAGNEKGGARFGAP